MSVFTTYCRPGAWLWCVLDNIAHEWFGPSLDREPVPWICRRHDAAIYRDLVEQLPTNPFPHPDSDMTIDMRTGLPIPKDRP
ncbi:hypothetical protein [Nocardia wallacei]|uniref:hypothetical protein n=1 Tax=Nocardia wallacei TaxID=480035 RepID=UPI002454520E|nr:hypothetical protein [Nocardia wallacei]